MFVSLSSVLRRNNTTLLHRSIRAGKVRFYSKVLLNENNTNLKDQIKEEQSASIKRTEAEEENIESEPIPWYLREDSSSPLVEAKEIELPKVPDHAHASVQTFLELLSKEYGLENINLFDLTSLEEDHAYSTSKQPTDYIIICTGKSEKHIYKAANELRTYIKHNHNLIPRVEGMVSSGTSPAARRRMLRRARKGPLATDNDYGKAPNSWIVCDTYVGNVFIHILTAERRDELNLESLWCPEEEAGKYAKHESSVADSDDIFIGIRRGFHTATLFSESQRCLYSTVASSSLENILHRLAAEKVEITNYKLQDYIQTFESCCCPGLKDYNTKFKFYKLIHLINPELISFEKVASSILEKYNSLSIALNKDIDLKEERIQDIINFMKLLIDSPEIKEAYKSGDPNLYSDELCDRLAQFTSTLLRFSNQQLDLSAYPEFIPLLWRLSFVGTQEPFIGSKVIENIIYNSNPIPEFSPGPSIIQAGNRARDILDLINFYNNSTNNSTTNSFKELILFTYGNAGKWQKFWKEWEVSLNLLSNQGAESKYLIKNWVRLVVYLATRNDKSAIFHFLYNHWDNSTSVARSFLKDFKSNNFEFNSTTEKRSFKYAMNKILQAINQGNNKEAFTYIKRFVDDLD